MVVNIVDVGWATSKSGCLPITGYTTVPVFQHSYALYFSLWFCVTSAILHIRPLLLYTVLEFYSLLYMKTVQCQKISRLHETDAIYGFCWPIEQLMFRCPVAH